MARINELPEDILFDCLSLLGLKYAAQTSILSTKWRYLWTHSTNLDFDPQVMYPEEFETFSDIKYETRNYFAWIDQVVDMHRGPSIDKFRVHSRYVTSYATQVEKWIKFALSKRVKELVLDFIGIGLLTADHSKKGHPFGFDTLRHPPCYSGITALQSLHLNYVNISDEFVEFLLSCCHHLERLHLEETPVSNLKIKTSKLKYLTIIMRFHDLEELEIEAENLLYFEYKDTRHKDSVTHIVFKSLPMLVETSFAGSFCLYPFPIFNKLSVFSNQLCKLSLSITVFKLPHDGYLVDGAIPIFPNVKHFTCTIDCESSDCILFVNCFIKACLKLEEFKLQVLYYLLGSSIEASELQKIDLEDEKENVETEIDYNYDHNLETDQVSEGELENMNELKQSHPNLRTLELVGFLGVRVDVEFALAVVSYACSLKTVICDPMGLGCSCSDKNGIYNHPDEYDVAKTRARKLAKIVSPKINVIIK